MNSTYCFSTATIIRERTSVLCYAYIGPIVYNIDTINDGGQGGFHFWVV